MGPTMMAICERETQAEIDEFRNQVIERMELNGLEGRFYERMKDHYYDNKIGYIIRCNITMTPTQFIKKLLIEELV